MTDRGTALRILAADDNAMSRLLLRTILEQVGARTQLASDGAEAVSAAGETAFDIILLDLHMPVLDGLAATRAIRGAGANRLTPILALTGDASPTTMRACLDAGMSGHIEKPVDASRLLAAITSALAPDAQSGQGVHRTKAG